MAADLSFSYSIICERSLQAEREKQIQVTGK